MMETMAPARRSPSTAAAPFTEHWYARRGSSIGGWVMPEARQVAARSAIGSLALIAAVVAFGAAAFAYTAGWFSPDRLTPTNLVAAFKSPPPGAPLGHRRNHAKGIC